MLRVGRFLLFHDLTIDKVQVTIHIHPGRTSPNPPNSPDPDCDPGVRESVWMQWIKPCKIPHFSLTERTYLTQKRSISRTDSSWQSWGQRFDPAYLHHVKSLEILEISRLFRCLPPSVKLHKPLLLWNLYGIRLECLLESPFYRPVPYIFPQGIFRTFSLTFGFPRKIFFLEFQAVPSFLKNIFSNLRTFSEFSVFSTCCFLYMEYFTAFLKNWKSRTIITTGRAGGLH